MVASLALAMGRTRPLGRLTATQTLLVREQQLIDQALKIVQPTLFHLVQMMFVLIVKAVTAGPVPRLASRPNPASTSTRLSRRM